MDLVKSQAQMDPVRVEEDEDGFMNGRLVRKYRRSPDQHHAVTVGVALENTILGLIMPLPLIHVCPSFVLLFPSFLAMKRDEERERKTRNETE